MTAEQARELFSAALDGELEGSERDAFERALLGDAALAQEYAAFRATLAQARAVAPALTRAAPAQSGVAADAQPPTEPDLLPGVQRRLRQRSRGRFYGDRFSERLGRGLTQPLVLALIMLALLAVAWFGLGLFEGVTFSPPSPPAHSR
jgi:anti-sigma factor RsiW